MIDPTCEYIDKNYAMVDKCSEIAIMGQDYLHPPAL
jgi:hypothetical protein